MLNRNCIIDKNAKIGKDVTILNKDVSLTSHTSWTTIFSKYHFPILGSNKVLIRMKLLSVHFTNSQGVQEADRPEEGFYIRFGITIILEKATINDGTVI